LGEHLSWWTSSGAEMYFRFMLILKRFRLSSPTALSLLMVAAAAQVARPQSQPPPGMKISLEEAIRLAIEHNHALKAARTQILQSQAQEITAAIRPNPVFDYDDLFVPITPHDF